MSMTPRLLHLQGRLLSGAPDSSPTCLLDISTWTWNGPVILNASKSDPNILPVNRLASFPGLPVGQPRHPRQRPGSHLLHPHVPSVTRPRKFSSISFSPSRPPQHLSAQLLLGSSPPSRQACFFHGSSQNAFLSWLKPLPVGQRPNLARHSKP